jgi:1,4-alpha-glucan branching enzyme
MNKGYFMPVLHAHLPYVRHPEHEFFLEENWFFEATVECYIPLILMLGRLVREDVQFGIAISLSPTLLEMLSDELLMKRLRRHMSRLVSLSKAEVSRTIDKPELNSVARMYFRKWRDTLSALDSELGGDIIGSLRKLGNYPGIEFITTSATHAFLPNIMPVPEAVRAQVEGGMRVFERHMGKRPEGFWLPECGYRPGLDEFIMNSGAKYFFLEAHGILHASPRPRHGIYRPLECASGAVAFGRDPFAAERVWCARRGYPADPVYRDFFDDLGFGEPHNHVREHISPMLYEGKSAFTGIKYKRITAPEASKKDIYEPSAAGIKALEHAGEFVSALGTHVSMIQDKYGFAPLITAPYDAELFGHWWFEGPLWLEAVLRATSGGGGDSGGSHIRSITPSGYMAASRGEIETAEPSMSSWGMGGYSAIWTEPEEGQAAARLLSSARRLSLLTRRSYSTPEYREIKRVLDQAMRELMLAESSDWLFMMEKGAHRGYAAGKLKEHLGAFDELIAMAEKGVIDRKRLIELEGLSPLMRQEGSELFT